MTVAVLPRAAVQRPVAPERRRMTAPIDSVLAKLAARRGFIAPEIAERLAARGQPAASGVVTIPRDARTMRVTARMRASGVLRNEKDWHLPGMFIQVRDGAGARIDQPPAPSALIERDADWATLESESSVPRGGVVVQVHLTVCGPAGTLEVDDMVVEANPT